MLSGAHFFNEQTLKKLNYVNIKVSTNVVGYPKIMNNILMIQTRQEMMMMLLISQYNPKSTIMINRLTNLR